MNPIVKDNTDNLVQMHIEYNHNHFLINTYIYEIRITFTAS